MTTAPTESATTETADAVGIRSSALFGLRPYHEEAAVTIYHGDCRQIVPLLGRFDLLLTDPPYGIGKDGQKRTTGGHGGRKAYDFLGWDAAPPSPSHALRPRQLPAQLENRNPPAILRRARNRCEKCGLENHSTVLSRCRTLLCDPKPYKEAAADLGFYHEPGNPAIVIVLTIAHLDHDTRNNDEKNLAALCQKCHLAHDKDHHTVNAARTRRRQQAQLELNLTAPT